MEEGREGLKKFQGVAFIPFLFSFINLIRGWQAQKINLKIQAKDVKTKRLSARGSTTFKLVLSFILSFFCIRFWALK